MTRPLRTLLLALDAEDSRATTELLGLVTDGRADLDPQVVLWHGGPHLGALRAQAPVALVTDLGARTPAALAEKVLVRTRQPQASHALRRRRLGLSPWGRRPPEVVALATPRAAPLLRYLPDPLGVPLVVLVPAGEMTDQRYVPVSAEDLALLLEHADRFLVETDASWVHLTDTLGVDPRRLVKVGETIEADRPERPAASTLVELRHRLGIAPGAPVIVGGGPLVWDGGTDLFVRIGWMLRERLGHDVELVWVGAPGEELELSQLRHDIAQVGLGGHVHLLGPEDEDALWLGDVHLVTSRLPDTPLQHLPAASQGQALVGWEAPLLRRFTGDDAGVLVDFLDMAGLAGAVAALLADEAARRDLGQRGFERYCDWHVAADRPAFLMRLLRESR